MYSSASCWPRRRLDNGQADQQSDQQARQAHDDECDSPAEVLVDPTADQKTEQDADVDAHRVNRQGASALLGRIVVRDQAVRGRCAASLTDTHADSRRQQLPVVADSAAEGGECAPHGDRSRQDVAAVANVRPAGNRNAAGNVKNGEAEAGQQAELSVAESQVRLDRLLQYDQNLAVNEVDDVHQHQKAEHVAAVSGRGGFGRRHRQDVVILLAATRPA